MREEHPIDKRFKALYDAEATPPEAVHEALAARMGWSAGTPGGAAWKPWVMAASALVVIGVGIGLWMAGDQEVASTIVEHGNTQQTSANSTNTTASDPGTGGAVTSLTDQGTDHVVGEAAATSASNTTVQQNTATQESAEKKPVAAHGRDRKVLAESASTLTAAGTNNAERPDAVRGNTASSGATTTTTAANNVHNADDEVGDGTASQDPHGRSDVAFHRGGTIATTGTDQQATWLAAIPQPRIDLTAGTPLAGRKQSDYVVPHGCCWVGAYAGIGTVNGQWRGDDASALSGAETWRSTAQYGVLVGREWHSGWSLSGGLGVARVRSSFSHEAQGSSQQYTQVDTTWIESAMQDIPVYTWMIDSLVEVRPGSTVRSDARNYYTAVQVPLTVAWHADVRRLRYGAFGGVTAWIPTQRKGMTLVQASPDAGLSTANLSDARVNERFGAQLHGQLGLSLGYSITEHFSAYAEPMISTPLVAFGDHDTPWLTRPLLQLRLQHALCSKSR